MDSDDPALDADFSPRRKFRGLPPILQPSDASIKSRRKSIRTRPSQYLAKQDAPPLSPMKDSAPHPPQLQPRASKMSLFNLFSKPKVEKARGYAEPGLAASPVLRSKEANASRPDLLAKVESNHAPEDPIPRTTSAMSFRNLTRPASRTTMRSHAPQPTSRERSEASWAPPPLFQAYPQATRYGTLESGMMSTDKVLQKSKSKKYTGLMVELSPPQGTMEDNGSIETRRTARTTLRHVTHGSINNVELPKKIFVLVTSGYLLQYAEYGPSDRLPERVLQLGKESAAFACDLIPGKHYVLQISQAVDQQGVLVANSGSIFQRLGLRSAATKRTTSNLLLVMPNALEMDSWMTAIREDIEALGGQRTRPDTAVRPKTRDAKEDFTLKQSPSLSHRYQVSRDRSKVSLALKPSQDALDDLPPPPRIRGEDELSETTTIDGIEEEAAQLAEEPPESPSINRDPDAQSVRSSVAASVDQHRLNSLRGSQRISHSTFATTVATSRTSSLNESPPSESSAKDSTETARDSVHSRSPYRTLSSYAMSRRRSAMPMPNLAPRDPLPSLDMSAQMQRTSALDTGPDSPVTGRNSPLPMPMSPRKLMVASSEPNLRAAADIRAKHDSKMHTPPTLSEEAERPQSFVGDLPSPAAIAGDRSPSKRMSLIQAATAQAHAHRASLLRSSQRNAEQARTSRRYSSQPFNLPLKINPSTPENRPPTRHEDRGSFNNVDEGNGEPVVHTLTAKVDPSHRLSVSSTSRNPSRTPSGRLSLFPTPTSTSPAMTSPAIPSPGISEPLKRSPSATVISSYTSPPTSGHMLRRPVSLQVRSDHAPFLKGVRSSTAGPPNSVPTGRSFTAPIRSLKPSRSSTNFSARLPPQPSPTDPFTVTAKTLDNPQMQQEEEADKATPLRCTSPLPTRPPSRASMRKVRGRTSLPELDLGMPVVGLGPPAPPPQAPLPAPPPSSRPTSPLPGAAGLGIRV